MSRYKSAKGETALGVYYTFEGPGLSTYGNGVHFLQALNARALTCVKEEVQGRERGEVEAKVIVHMLHAAFEAGRDDAKREIRATLGVSR